MRALIILALAVLAATGVSAQSQDTCPIGGHTAITCPVGNDAVIRSAILTRLAGSVSTACYPVYIEVADGMVTVWGQVNDPGKIGLASMLIATVRGVRCINNQLCLTMTSQRDVEILGAVRRALSKATFPTNQMDVLVSDGIVELRGEAPTDYVREQAGGIASGVPGVEAVHNNLVISSQGGMF